LCNFEREEKTKESRFFVDDLENVDLLIKVYKFFVSERLFDDLKFLISLLAFNKKVIIIKKRNHLSDLKNKIQINYPPYLSDFNIYS